MGAKARTNMGKQQCLHLPPGALLTLSLIGPRRSYREKWDKDGEIQTFAP